MATPLIGATNLVDGATMTASAQSGDLSPSNMADPISTRVWRTTSLTAYGQADFGENKDISALALRFSRAVPIPTSGTVTHALDADGGTPGAGAAYDSGAVAIGTTDGYGYHLHLPGSTVAARYWRFTFNLSGVSLIDVARAWAGEPWRPENGAAYGYNDGWADASRVRRASQSGTAFTRDRARKRAVRFELAGLGQTDWQTALDLTRVAGVGSEVLFALDPAASDRTKEPLIGLVQELNPVEFRNPVFKSLTLALLET